MSAAVTEMEREEREGVEWVREITREEEAWEKIDEDYRWNAATLCFLPAGTTAAADGLFVFFTRARNAF